MAQCGWEDARELEQQDTSEAFAFLTETLELPLLPLQVDLFHNGKRDADDHKVVYERLLNLAVPPDPDGKGIKLEDCIEEYFNTQVDVLRDNPEEKKVSDLGSTASGQHIEDAAQNVEDSSQGSSRPPLTKFPPVIRRRTLAAGEELFTPPSPSSAHPSPLRHRSASVIQRVVLDQEGRPVHHRQSESSTTLLQKAVKTGSTVVKAVTIPAWQFFRLIRMNHPVCSMMMMIS